MEQPIHGYTWLEGNLAAWPRHEDPPQSAQNVASQSSTPSWSGGAGLAVDSNVQQDWERCSFTERESDPWWRVDLSEPQAVTEIRLLNVAGGPRYWMHGVQVTVGEGGPADPSCELYGGCLLYTSDAADEEDSVDLGGRRIIKKKKKY
eukprot:TRINITY_DN3997_c0_g1_i1.p1 TRINITY_DN3997_c0_g1~~TRINITY_DN3997_c0_g1_i1.p1  ORF type:complete len:148 (-),score=34.41 TRINITY_DN3997_c0_g1_i1:87-530(-)